MKRHDSTKDTLKHIKRVVIIVSAVYFSADVIDNGCIGYARRKL